MTASKRIIIQRMKKEKKMEVERKWHTAYAWFPVLSDDGYWVWLDTVHRCRAHRFGPWRYIADVHNILTVADET